MSFPLKPMRKATGAMLGALALLSATAAQAQEAVDPNNPTCPPRPSWTTNRQMQFTLEEQGERRILRAEGQIDDLLIPRLEEALQQHQPIDEIWLRSPGGNARIGNQAGAIIRRVGIPTRIPAGWACFSACNFVFMGGPIRIVDPGGLFVVHMFTHAQDRQAIRQEVSQGEQNTIDLIGEIEQGSALLASEDNDFLIRMGISRRLLTEVMYRQKALEEQGGDRSTRRCLTQEEVHRYNVANFR